MTRAHLLTLTTAGRKTATACWTSQMSSGRKTPWAGVCRRSLPPFQPHWIQRWVEQTPSPIGARAAMAIDNISPSDEEILLFSHGLELKSRGNLEYHGRKIGRVFVSPFASHASAQIISDKHGSECRHWVNLIEVPNLINCRRWIAMQDVYTSKEKHLEA